jgi:xanthine dehydrogenase accessory factor
VMVAMASSAKSLTAFLDASAAVAFVEVADAKGSTPREKGAWMLVSPDAIYGTIGGGQLEYMALDEARAVLHASRLPSRALARRREGAAKPMFAAPANDGALRLRLPLSAERAPIPQGGTKILDIPLGPEIGQCCGGRVEVAISLVDKARRGALLKAAKADEARRPHVLIFGGGHVGHALAAALALLPVRPVVVETRRDALVGISPDVETRLTPVPEEMVREAPPGAAFVVLTHDHALDFLIVAEALRRGDAAYVGMIGSKTKKATFRSWFLKTAGGSESEFARLVSPIGGDALRDKRPAVIAALAAAEIMTALAAG